MKVPWQGGDQETLLCARKSQAQPFPLPGVALRKPLSLSNLSSLAESPPPLGCARLPVPDTTEDGHSHHPNSEGATEMPKGQEAKPAQDALSGWVVLTGSHSATCRSLMRLKPVVSSFPSFTATARTGREPSWGRGSSCSREGETQVEVPSTQLVGETMQSILENGFRLPRTDSLWDPCFISGSIRTIRAKKLTFEV